MAYGSIDDQASPTNVKPQPASRGGSGRAMGDIDEASSPPSQNSPPDPGKILGSIDLAIHGGTNSTSTAQDVTTTSRMDAGCGDQLQAERKMNNSQQLASRLKAYNAGQTQNGDPIVPDFQAGEIEY